MVDSNSNDIYDSYIAKAITDIQNNSKYFDEKAMTDYVIKIFTTNIDESFIESIIKKLLHQNVLENKPTSKGNSFIVAKENSEDKMTPKVLSSQTPMPQIPELCDTPQICKEENSIGETFTKQNKITLTNRTTEFF